MTERRELPPIDELELSGERRVLMAADTADCLCPDFCERDHGNE
jgi:hypothetical protein